jgi:hypothetical protein
MSRGAITYNNYRIVGHNVDENVMIATKKQ